MTHVNRKPAIPGRPEEAFPDFRSVVRKANVVEVLGDHIRLNTMLHEQTQGSLKVLQRFAQEFLLRPEDFFPSIIRNPKGIAFIPTRDADASLPRSNAIAFIIQDGSRRVGHNGDPAVEVWLLHKQGDEWVRQAGAGLNQGIPLQNDLDHVPTRSLTQFPGEKSVDSSVSIFPSKVACQNLVAQIKQQVDRLIVKFDSYAHMSIK